MKESLKQLAVFGGSPSFLEKLHVGRPNIGNRQRLFKRIDDILDRRWLTNNGLCVQEFEQKVVDLLGVKHCIAMCNGTIALEIIIKAVGLTGEVIVPSFTFIATAHSLQWQGITPVFCDVDPQTHNMDPCKIEKLITPRTTGIIGVHLWGRLCEVEALTKIAQHYNLKLLFDAAHAFGCSHKEQMIGNFGIAEVFSFHATKFFNTFEGGAATTNDDDLAHKIRLMKNFGFAGYDNVVHIGINGKMNEISAAMGLNSLESLEEFITVNYQNYIQYQRELADIPGLHLLVHNENEKCNYQYIVLEVDEAITRISRDELAQILWAENILVRRYFYPGCHRMEPYVSHFSKASLPLPETERLTDCVLVLPTGATIGEKEIIQICKILKLVIENASEVQRRMERAN